MKKLFVLMAFLLCASVSQAQVTSADLMGLGMPPALASNVASIGKDATISLDDGTVAAPSLHFEDDSNLGLYRTGANELAVSVGAALGAKFTDAKVEVHHATAPRLSIVDNGSERGYLAYTSGGGLVLDSDAGLSLNVGNAVAFKPEGIGGDLPATCTVGDFYVDNNDDGCDEADDAGGVAVCFCTATNTWSILN